MLNIIVPTDFSDHARTALRYAINIANQFESTIHLIHIFKVRNQAGNFVSMRDFLRKDAEEDLSKLVQEVKSSLFKDTALEAKAIEGYTTDTICSYAKAKKADLIVMGTQGASGLKEIFLGSNTSGVLDKTEVPVLAIPKDSEYKRFENIVLSVDSLDIDEAVVAPLVSLAKQLKSKVHVLHLEPAPIVIGVDPKITNYLGDIPHSFHQEELKDDVNVGINKYVTEKEADMLCLVKRKRSYIDNLFHVSVTKKVAFNSPVPLLVLKDK